jgi:hypothetical protein
MIAAGNKIACDFGLRCDVNDQRGLLPYVYADRCRGANLGPSNVREVFRVLSHDLEGRRRRVLSWLLVDFGHVGRRRAGAERLPECVERRI